MNNTRNLFLSVLLLSVLGLTACEHEGPAEKLGKDIDNMAEDIGDKVEDSTDSASDKMEEMGDKIEDSTD